MVKFMFTKLGPRPELKIAFKKAFKKLFSFLDLPIGPKPRAIETIPMAFPRSPSSLKRSAIIPKPFIKVNLLNFIKKYKTGT